MSRAEARRAVRLAVEALGTQASFAASAGLDAGTVGDFLRGKRWANSATRRKIEAALGWPAGYVADLAQGYRAPERVDESDVAGWIPTDREFSARLALVRNRMGWNVKEAALACGLPAQNWRNWEQGKLPQSMPRVCGDIARSTGVDPHWLAFGSYAFVGREDVAEGASDGVADDPTTADAVQAMVGGLIPGQGGSDRASRAACPLTQGL